MRRTNGAGERSNLEPEPAAWVGGRQPANKESKIGDFGAPDGSNLEPSSLDQVLSDLEVWSDIINSDQDLIRALEALGNASDDIELDADIDPDQTEPPAWEPSP